MAKTDKHGLDIITSVRAREISLSIDAYRKALLLHPVNAPEGFLMNAN